MASHQLRGFCIILAMFSALSASAVMVNVLAAPANCLVPEMVVDGKGVVHQVYGLGNDVFFRQSTNDGHTFTAAVKLNSSIK